MQSPGPTRWLAPLALVAAVVAVLFVIQSSTGESDSGDDTPDAPQERREASDTTTGTTARTTTNAAPERRTYTVRPGDTLALIAERTGVTVETLLELNPDIDPNSLTVGEKIKLTE
jgi:LysM repeat protein